MSTIEVELTPRQPDPVTAAIAVLLEATEPSPGPDPWWQAGLEESLEP